VAFSNPTTSNLAHRKCNIYFECEEVPWTSSSAAWTKEFEYGTVDPSGSETATGTYIPNRCRPSPRFEISVRGKPSDYYLWTDRCVPFNTDETACVAATAEFPNGHGDRCEWYPAWEKPQPLEPNAEATAAAAACAAGTYYPAKDGSNALYPLYTQEACQALPDGIYHANGECTKKTGGSYTYDCRVEISSRTNDETATSHGQGYEYSRIDSPECKEDASTAP